MGKWQLKVRFVFISMFKSQTDEGVFVMEVFSFSPSCSK